MGGERRKNMKTNICTTKDQSARLLKCGVPAESADMSIDADTDKLYLSAYSERVDKVHEVPAWSLSRLLTLLPKEIKVDESPYDEIQKYGLLIYPYMGGWQVDYQYCEDDECHCLKCVYGADLIEACVEAIEWLSANGYKLKGGTDGED